MLKLPGVPITRFFSSTNQILEHLPNRTLIRVSGSEASTYLQGLITNDIEHLKCAPNSMYSMFLNTAGRVLYDVIIYKNLEPNTFLIECDNRISDNLERHLKVHRVRRKIDIMQIGHEFKVYAYFNKFLDNQEPSKEVPNLQHKIVIYRDPRLSNLGFRILAKSDQHLETTTENYRWMRYNLGVGEGIDDLPPGDCFPLEANCDYLHGVSFHKGCYIGQELTARVYHTGVVRKRLMPIYFTKIPTKTPDPKIVVEKINLGKLRGIEKDSGLALLRFEKALSFEKIQVGNGEAQTRRPHWWPVEAPKQKVTYNG